MAGNDTRSDANQSFFVFVKDSTTGVIRRVAIPSDVQIGLAGQPAELQLNGRLSVASKTYSVDSTNKGIINVTNHDTVVGLRLVITPASGRISVKLPSTPREGQLHFVKDLTGTADTVPIDVIPPSGVLIDDQTSITISEEYGSVGLVWLYSQWRIIFTRSSSSGGGGSGASTSASYVTINSEASLTNERRLTGSTNILMTDLGANSTVSFNLSQILGVAAGTYTYATVTADAFGRVIGISNGSAPPASTAGYLTAGSEPSLPNRRQMSGGLGTTVSDAGAGNTFAYHVNPVVIPFLTGNNGFSGINTFGGTTTFNQTASFNAVSVFNQPATFNQTASFTNVSAFYQPATFNVGLTGSLSQLPNGAGPYIVGIGSVTVTTSSIGQIIISGSGGSGSSSTGSSSPFIITGSGGTSVSSSISGSFTIYTVSSSAPTPFIITGSGGTAVSSSISGSYTIYTISSSLTTGNGSLIDIVGIGGTSVSSSISGSYTIYTISSSLGSGSQGSFISIVGAGGTFLSSTISASTVIYTVSSSIYAERQAYYLQLSASAQNTNARTLVVGSGLSSKETGTALTLFSTTDRDIPVVLTALTASFPRGRALLGHNGITITDLGSGSNVIVGFVPIASRSASAYHGYCTGSLSWSSTTWTDFDAVPGNFVDTIQDGISRSGSTWTVDLSGYYKWHSYFNSAGTNEFIAWRLSGSNGTLIQRTTFANSSDSHPSLLEGVIQLTSGSVYRLQYLVKQGTTGSFTVNDPIDGENMRTGEVSLFRIAEPVTLNYVPTVDPFGWIQHYYTDFQQLGSGSFGVGGNQVFNSVPWNIENYGLARSVGLDPNFGLTFSNNTNNTDYAGAAARNAPLASLRMVDVFPGFSYPNMEFRIWTQLGINNADQTAESQFIGIEKYQTTALTIAQKKGFTAAGFGFQAQASINNNNIFTQTTDVANTSHDIVMLHWRNDRQVEHWTGTSVNGTFPDASTLTLRGITLITTSSFFSPPISGSFDFAFTLGSVTNNTAGNFNSSFKKFKFEYLQTTAGQVVGTSPTTYWRQLSSSIATSGSANWTTLMSFPVTVTGSGAPVLIQYSVCSEKTGAGSNYARLRWDGVVYDQSISSYTSASAMTMASTYVVMSASSGLHTVALDFRTDANTGSINLPGEHANLLVQELPFGSTLQIISGTNGSGADVSASYLLFSFTGSLPNARVLANGGGISFTDGGPGGTLTVTATGGGGSGNVDPEAPMVVTFQTGSVPSGRTLTGGASITITDFGSGSAVLVSDTGHHWASTSGKIKTTGSVSVDSLNRFADAIGTDVFFYVSGSQGLAPTHPERKVGVLNDTYVSGGMQIVNRVSLDGNGAFARDKGVDVNLWVSGTTGAAGANARKSVFGGDSVFSGSVVALGSPGFTGSLTQTSQGLSFIVGIGGTGITTNSLGQVIVSSSFSAGTGGTTTVVVSGVAAQGQAAYHGYTTSSLNWINGSGSFADITNAMAGETLTDSIVSNILHGGATWSFINGGLYWFHADFNANGSNAYTTLRWRGSNGASISRSTYRSSVNDQSSIKLEGVFSASIGETWTLEFTTSGSIVPWTGSNPLPGGGNMVTGEVSMFMLPTNNITQPVPTIVTATSSLAANVAIPTQLTYIALADVTSSLTDVAYWAKCSGIAAGVNTLWLKLVVDGVDWPQSGHYVETSNSGSGFGGNISGRITGLASGTHTFSFRAARGSAGNIPTVSPLASPNEGATLMLLNLTASSTGIGPVPKAPLYTLPMLAGTVTTNTAIAVSKQSLGMAYFSPSTVQGFGGTSRRYYYRTVIDCITAETNLSAAVDLFDVNGIVAYPPGIVTGSIMSSSNSTATQLTVDLTNLLQLVTGSGLFEARLWRTVSGSLASVANCRNSRIDVEFS